MRIERVTKSISFDRATPQPSKNILIVKITCFIVEIFALKVNVLREFLRKSKIFEILMDLNRNLMTFPIKDTNFSNEFSQTMHPKNMKQITTNREFPVLLRDVLIKFFGDVVAVISIF